MTINTHSHDAERAARLALSAPECRACGEPYPARRHALGYRTCLDCGDAEASAERAGWTVVPMPKQSYTRITRKEELLHLNQKVR